MENKINEIKEELYNASKRFSGKLVKGLSYSIGIAAKKECDSNNILAVLPDNADVFLLDEHGTERRSIEFADWIGKRMTNGRNIVFVIGGPFGFSEAVYKRAKGLSSLSQMTFSHQMIRLLFVEQIYRAMTILKGEKYHHE